MAYQVREGVDYRILEDDYRSTFFKSNPPKKTATGQEYYSCCYCGQSITPQEMQVDHIIPKTRLKAGILWNPNKEWNLCESCGPCNASKSNYLDIRVLIGFKSKYLGLRNIGRIANKNTTKESKALRVVMSIGVFLIFTLMYLVGPIFSLILSGLTNSFYSVLDVVSSIMSAIKYNLLFYTSTKRFEDKQTSNLP